LADEDDEESSSISVYLNTICCSIDNLLCSWNGTSLCLWKLNRSGE
jgi:hypothetical protein